MTRPATPEEISVVIGSLAILVSGAALMFSRILGQRLASALLSGFSGGLLGIYMGSLEGGKLAMMILGILVLVLGGLLGFLSARIGAGLSLGLIAYAAASYLTTWAPSPINTAAGLSGLILGILGGGRVLTACGLALGSYLVFTALQAIKIDPLASAIAAAALAILALALQRLLLSVP